MTMKEKLTYLVMPMNPSFLAMLPMQVYPGGAIFTPQHVSRLIAGIALHGQTSVNKIYDPAAGSGSLLLQAQKHLKGHFTEEGLFGQEIHSTTYNMARMNICSYITSTTISSIYSWAIPSLIHLLATRNHLMSSFPTRLLHEMDRF